MIKSKIDLYSFLNLPADADYTQLKMAVDLYNSATISTRLDRYMKENGIDKVELSKRLGWRAPSSLGRYMTGGSQIGSAIYKKIGVLLGETEKALRIDYIGSITDQILKELKETELREKEMPNEVFVDNINTLWLSFKKANPSVTQADFARDKLNGCSQPGFSAILSGRVKVGSRRQLELANAFGVTVSELMNKPIGHFTESDIELRDEVIRDLLAIVKGDGGSMSIEAVVKKAELILGAN
ncbi:hypothetical protein AB4254_08945 [Vibrio breoganii]